MTLEAHRSTPTSNEELDRESTKRSTLLNKAVALCLKNIALFASAVTSPKVPVGMATTKTADEMPEIRL